MNLLVSLLKTFTFFAAAAACVGLIVLGGETIGGAATLGIGFGIVFLIMWWGFYVTS